MMIKFTHRYLRNSQIELFITRISKAIYVTNYHSIPSVNRCRKFPASI